MIKVVEKPWGKEEWLSLNDKYCLKRITLWKGCRTSLQYHEKKMETNYIESGRALVTYKPKGSEELMVREVGPGFSLHIIPGEVHRFEALEDLVMFEASTIEVDDVIRLEDSYGRKGTSNP